MTPKYGLAECNHIGAKGRLIPSRYITTSALYGGNMKLDTLRCALECELADIYSAEQQLVTSLPKMISAVSNQSLRVAIQDHLSETREQVARLEEIFQILGRRPTPETCKAMEGLLKEAEGVIAATGDPDVKDAVLIGCAQRVEHYEMAAYGVARTFAEHLGLDSVVSLLQLTLDEEGAADKKLTAIAQGGLFTEGVNDKAETHTSGIQTSR